LDSLTVSGWVEDVANLLTIRECSVWHLDALVVVRVGGGDKELASLEGVEIVLDISLFVWMIPNGLVLSSTVDGSGHLVDVRVGVHVLPQRLSVSWIVATTVLLLTTIVVEWNTLGGECESKCTLEHSDIMVRVEESSVVVVVNENTESIHVLKVALLFVKSILDVVHRLATEDVLDREVHWVVEKSGQGILVWSNVVWITVEVLAHLEHARSLSILGPEVHWNLWNRVDSNTIETVCIHQILDPILQVFSHKVIFLSEIW